MFENNVPLIFDKTDYYAQYGARSRKAEWKPYASVRPLYSDSDEARLLVIAYEDSQLEHLALFAAYTVFATNKTVLVDFGEDDYMLKLPDVADRYDDIELGFTDMQNLFATFDNIRTPYVLSTDQIIDIGVLAKLAVVDWLRRQIISN